MAESFRPAGLPAGLNGPRLYCGLFCRLDYGVIGGGFIAAGGFAAPVVPPVVVL